MSSDTWTSMQKLKMKQDNLRERIQRRRKEHKDILANTGNPSSTTGSEEKTISNVEDSKLTERSISEDLSDVSKDTDKDKTDYTLVDPEIEKILQQYLCHHSLNFPMDSDTLMTGLNKILQQKLSKKVDNLTQVEHLLHKQAAQLFIEINTNQSDEASGEGSKLIVLSVRHAKLSAVAGELEETVNITKENSIVDNTKKIEDEKKDSASSKHKPVKRHASDQGSGRKHRRGDSKRAEKSSKTSDSNSSEKNMDDIEALLSTKSAREQDSKRVAEEIQELLGTASTKELSLAEKFRTLGGSQVKEFCPHGTRFECMRHRRTNYSCSKLHFKKLIKPHTDESLGDCSFLNTCFHMDTCKYVHYEIDYKGSDLDPRYQRRGKKRQESEDNSLLPKLASDEDYLSRKMLPPQWVNCDIRYLDVSTLGKFSVIMADPPWDIHMELPYGTMQDDEMRNLRIQDLADDGLLFLWVTGRAMELGRELFEYWGYKRCDELIWVKTNQLQRLIRTGRTGHWLNHGKEHCLVGIKGNPKGINRGLDCDVLVAEVRDTSHKPDEIYGIIERLSPGTRKLELFGRMHNVQPNWVTIGNQLDGVHLVEPDVVERFKQKYPDGKVTKPVSTTN